MKVTEKKLDDGRILLEAVASTAEVSHAPVSYTHLTLPTICSV